MELAVSAASAGIAPLALLGIVLCLAANVKRASRFALTFFVVLAGIFGCIILDVWASNYVKGDNLQLLGLECFMLSFISLVMFFLILASKAGLLDED